MPFTKQFKINTRGTEHLSALEKESIKWFQIFTKWVDCINIYIIKAHSIDLWMGFCYNPQIQHEAEQGQN